MEMKAKLAIGLFVLVSLLGCASYTSQAPVRKEEPKTKVSTENVQKVLDKLEQYVNGQTSKSELNLDELEAARREYESWDRPVRVKLQQEQPLIHLLIDFVLLPMTKYPNLLSTPGEPERSKKLIRNYITRIENSYKEFRPAFFGQMLTSTYRRSVKTDTLVSALLDLDDAKPLTMKLLVAAKQEHDAFAERLSDIEIYEDIYSNLEEVKNTLNYLNRVRVALLRERIFPLISEVKTEKQLLELKKIYLAALREYNYDVIDGTIMQVA